MAFIQKNRPEISVEAVEKLNFKKRNRDEQKSTSPIALYPTFVTSGRVKRPPKTGLLDPSSSFSTASLDEDYNPRL